MWALQAVAGGAMLAGEVSAMPVSLDNILGSGALERLEDGAGLIHGLPRGAYTSEAFLALERERVFAPNWTFVEFAHALAEPGDVRPLSVAGLPILLLRDHEGVVRAFHNVCRHRGHLVVEAPGRGKRFLTCPYHAWRYGLDGALQATPHFAGYRQADPAGFSRERFGLVPLRAAVWQDWIFVNLDGAAPPLEDYVAPLAAELDGVDLARMTPLAVLDFGAVEANWKFLVENFVEPYHVPFVHPKSAGGQPLGDHYTFENGNCFGCAVDVAEQAAGKRSDALDVSARYLALFPNFILGHYAPDELGVHINLPEGAARTRQRRVIYHLGAAMPDDATIEAKKNLWGRVHREDHAIVEGLQRGRASPVLEDGGLLSPHWETSVHHFHKLIAAALT